MMGRQEDRRLGTAALAPNRPAVLQDCWEVTMRFQEALIGWKPGANKVRVDVKRDDEPDWVFEYFCYGGAVEAWVRELKDGSPELRAAIFEHYHRLVVSDGINPRAVHREFLKIDQYRERL